MKCPNCKKEIDSNDKFCGYCGYDLSCKNISKKNNKIKYGVILTIILIIIVVAMNSIPKAVTDKKNDLKISDGSSDYIDDINVYDNPYYDIEDYDKYFQYLYSAEVDSYLDVENEIANMQYMCYEINLNIDNGVYKSISEGNITFFADDNANLKKMIVNQFEKNQNYIREYYFYNDLLFFSYVYNDSEEYYMYYFDGYYLIHYNDNGVLYNYGEIPNNKWGYFTYREAYDLCIDYNSINDKLKDTPNAEYVLKDSNIRYIDKNELSDLSQWQLKIARNEIYARYGYTFDDDELNEYFSSKEWYLADSNINKDTWDEGTLNVYEVANRDLILEVEKEKGYL